MGVGSSSGQSMSWSVLGCAGDPELTQATSRGGTHPSAKQQRSSVLSGDARDGMQVTARMASRMPTSAGVVPDSTRIFFVTGLPGSGKSTQCKQLGDQLGYSHIHVSELLREEVRNQTKIGRQAQALMEAGEPVPGDLSVMLLKRRIIAADSAIVLLDGFPRSLEQAASFQENVATCAGMLYLDVPLDVSIERLAKADNDSAGTVKRLHQGQMEQLQPVCKHFTERGLCQIVSSVGTPEAVGSAVQDAMQLCLAQLHDGAKSVSEMSGDSDDEDGGESQTGGRGTPGEQDSDLVPTARMPSQAPWLAGDIPEDVRVVFVLGPPGSGKSTQCQRLLERYGYAHLYVGDLLRNEVASSSALGRTVEEHMANGELVPMHISLTLLKRAMLKSAAEVMLVDGFPRSLDQVSIFEKQVAACSAVLFYEVSQQAACQRLMKRGETSGRVDDNPEAIEKQFKTFMSQAMPVRDHYLKLGKCQVISGEAPPDAVFEATATALKGFGEGLLTPRRHQCPNQPPYSG